VARFGAGRRGPEPSGKEDEAIEFQKHFAERHGSLPPIHLVTRHVGSSHGATQFWRKFQSQSNALAREYGPRPKARRRSKWDASALAYQDEYLKKHGRLPTMTEVARRFGVHLSTVFNWQSLLEARRQSLENVGWPEAPSRDSDGVWLALAAIRTKYPEWFFGQRRARMTPRNLSGWRRTCPHLGGAALRAKQQWFQTGGGAQLLWAYRADDIDRIASSYIPATVGDGQGQLPALPAPAPPPQEPAKRKRMVRPRGRKPEVTARDQRIIQAFQASADVNEVCRGFRVSAALARKIKSKAGLSRPRAVR
jgi:hypothetical protein